MRTSQKNVLSRNKRPLEFYQAAWDKFHTILHCDLTGRFKCDIAVEAFAYAKLQFPEVQLSGCMTNRKTAHSYMMDDVKRKVAQAT